MDRLSNWIAVFFIYFAPSLIFAQKIKKSFDRAVQEVQNVVGFKTTTIPLLNFTSDDGVGYGVRVNFFDYDGKTVPYRRSYSLQTFFTTKGVWAHRLYMDAPNLLPGQRFEIELRYEQQKFANYFGELNDDELEELTREQKTFRRKTPKLKINWIRDLRSKWKHRAESQISYYSIKPNADADNVLSQLNPVGVDGGLYVKLHSSLQYDSRDRYIKSTKGVLEEIRIEYGFDGGLDYNGWKFGFEHRHFISLANQFVFGYRASIDQTIGSVPFFDELKVGGESTVRGEPSARVRGEGRMLFNAELRWQGIQLYKRQKIQMGVVMFADLGQAYSRSDGPNLTENWRRGVGGGLRFHWYSTIVRADLGYSDSGTGIYILFNHLF